MYMALVSNDVVASIPDTGEHHPSFIEGEAASHALMPKGTNGCAEPNLLFLCTFGHIMDVLTVTGHQQSYVAQTVVVKTIRVQ